MKIHYFVNSRSGYGHITRLVALIRAIDLQGLASDIDILTICADPSSHEFLLNSINGYSWINLCPLNYKSDFNDKDYKPNDNSDSISSFLINNSYLRAIPMPDVIITDWVDEAIYYLKTLYPREQILKLGIYHSDIWDHDYDDLETKNWKKRRRVLVEELDIFFHLKPLKSMYSKNVSNIVSVPLISRLPVSSRDTLRSLLSIKQEETVVLVYFGLDSVDRVYPFRDELNRLVDNISLKYTAIYMSGRELLLVRNGNRINIENIVNMQEGQDIVNLADVVLTKPGMSILSEIMSLKKPYIFFPPLGVEQKLKLSLMEQITLYPQIPVLPHEFDVVINRIDSVVTQRTTTLGLEKVNTNGGMVLVKLLNLIINRFKQAKNHGLSPYWIQQLAAECSTIAEKFW